VVAEQSIPAAVPSPPSRPPPAGSCDCHSHLFGPWDRYPLADPVDFYPPFAPAAAYLAMLARIGCDRGVIVHGTQYGLDCSNMLDTLALAPDRLRGVAAISEQTPREQLEHMSALGVCGARFCEISREGRPLPFTRRFSEIAQLAPTLRELRWHVQLWGTCSQIVEHLPGLLRLDVPIVLDHLGLPDVEAGVDGRDFRRLVDLCEREQAIWVKVTAQRPSGRFPDYEDVRPFFDALVAACPDRSVWGSDYPHMQLRERTPDTGHLLDLLEAWCGDEALSRRILVENPQRLYGFA
jgi:predicted TIM-barrel fold metal-dependent hydrolase